MYTYATIFFTLHQLFLSAFTWIFLRSERNQRVVRKFLLPIEVLAGNKRPEVIGLTEMDMVDLRKHARVVYFICSNIAVTFPCIFAFYVPYVYFKRFDLDKYWLNCILAHIWWHLWVFTQICGHCVSMAYFYLVCLVLKLRIKNIRQLLDYSEPPTIKLVHLVLRKHNDLCRTLDSYNKYWSIHIYSSHQCFLPLMTVMIYISFFAGGLLYVRVTMFVIFWELTFLLSFTCLSASDISVQVIVVTICKPQLRLTAFF